MKQHTKNYLEYFDLGKEDFIYCEMNWILNRVSVRAVDLHHIKYKSQGGGDEVDNIIALSREYHIQAHEEQLDKKYLSDIHNEFINNIPY
jgi:predicted restriction endonuclease